jgi:NADP-dependent 3-hydroxy acid dehydrogenase YdfG
MDKSAAQRIGHELAELGGVHVLVNNAGIMPLAPLLEDRVEEWEQTIDVNIKGVLYAIRAVLGDMMKRRDGHIVNVSSMAGRVSFAGGAVYCASKFAFRAISDALRREVLAYGVRVTDIAPGAVATELIQTVRHEETRKALTASGGFYPPGADILQPVDIANAVLYVVSQPPHVDIGELWIRPTVQDF